MKAKQYDWEFSDVLSVRITSSNIEHEDTAKSRVFLWFCAFYKVRMSLRIRALEYVKYAPGMVHTFRAQKYTFIFLTFLWISLDCTIWKMSRHVQFDRVCAAHPCTPGVCAPASANRQIWQKSPAVDLAPYIRPWKWVPALRKDGNLQYALKCALSISRPNWYCKSNRQQRRAACSVPLQHSPSLVDDSRKQTPHTEETSTE